MIDGKTRRVCGAGSNQFSAIREQTRVGVHFGHEDCGMVDVEGGRRRQQQERQEQNERASRWKECPTHALTGQEISFDS